MGDDTAQIRSDIEETRRGLGETARALTEELDPRTRARRAAEGAGDQTRERLQQVTASVREDPRPAIAAAGLLLLLVLWRRRR